MDVQLFSDLVGMVYNVALDADNWPFALASFAAFFGCMSAAIRIVDMDDFHVVFEVSSGARDEDVDAYAEHFAGVLPHFGMLKTASNHYADDVFVVGDHGAVRLEQADTLIEQLGKRRGVKGFVVKAGNRIVHIAMLCDGQSLECTRLSEALPLLVPHMQRAFMACRRMQELKYRTDSLEQAMNYFNAGVIMLDGAGTPVYMNRRAREIVANMQGLYVVSGQLTTTSNRLTPRLRQMVATAVAQGKQGGSRIEAMAIKPPGERHKLTIATVPLQADRQAAVPEHGDIHAALLIASPSFVSDLKPEALQMLANLTGAEARLALGLASGRSLGQYCKDSGIQIGTARGYLKQAFVKTGTNRQSELVSLVHSISFNL